MEENKISYNRQAFRIPAKDAPLADIYGYVEGFVKRITVREVNTKNGKKTVADVDINALIPDKRVADLFGAPFVNSYHSVSFRISYWNAAAGQIYKWPPQKNQKVLALIYNLKAEEVTGKDGKVYRCIHATGADYLRTNSAVKEDGVSALVGDSDTDRTEMEPETGGNTISKHFEVMEEYPDEEDLPF